MTDTNATSNTPALHCPECGRKGTKVKQITLRSLLNTAAAHLISESQYRFCNGIDCDTVYFGSEGEVFSKADLTVRVGVKEQASPRHVCYCFDHTVEEINAEVSETGRCTVLDDIKSRMKEACWCETKSPQGSCCLNTVSKFVKQALVGHGAATVMPPTSEELVDCCGDEALSNEAADTDGTAVHVCCSDTELPAQTKDQSQRTGLLAVSGSVLSALAASACCWLPLLLIAFGVSAGGVSAWFEQYRWLFLGITAILLGTGFYFVYFRKPHCTPDSACAMPNLKLQRFNRVMLWTATVVIVAAAAFPKYIGYLMPNGDTPQVNASVHGTVITAVIPIEGMTCEACTIHVKSELAKVPGVLSALVSYTDGNASVRFDSESPPTEADLMEAITNAGYRGDASSLNE